VSHWAFDRYYIRSGELGKYNEGHKRRGQWPTLHPRRELSSQISDFLVFRSANGCVFRRTGEVNDGIAKPNDPICRETGWTISSLRRPARLAGKLWGKPLKTNSRDAAAAARELDETDARDAETR